MDEKICKLECVIVWFRRDLRLEDNTALQAAIASGTSVLPLFIVDNNIINELSPSDSRLNFIFDLLEKMQVTLAKFNRSILCKRGEPSKVIASLLNEYTIKAIYYNKDYEPYALQRDQQVKNLLETQDIPFHGFKDQVIFEEHDIVKADGSPYTVFTPFKKRWIAHFESLIPFHFKKPALQALAEVEEKFPTRQTLGLEESKIKVPTYITAHLKDYGRFRDYPTKSTSLLGPHLRFGAVSIRQLIANLESNTDIFLSELIWREFFMQILFHFPRVVDNNFRPKYDLIEWRNEEKEFKDWCDGQTGYPLVDAGMRELNATGFMHNRVRMVAASFLCKHLLIDWRWGEAYFASKLLDFELSSNNGNWQWAAGTGCDAAPYFRVFNPTTQQEKFDKDFNYIKKWVPEFGTDTYAAPIVNHVMARKRAIETYKVGIQKRVG